MNNTMKKMIAAFAVIGALGSCSKKEVVTQPKTYMDTVSYAIGQMYSSGLPEFKDSLNADMISLAFKDAIDSNFVSVSYTHLTLPTTSRV